MITNTKTIEEALQLGNALPFAMLRSTGGVRIGRTPMEPEQADLIEARFFDASKEIRIFRQDSGLAAVELIPEPEDCILKDAWKLRNASRFGSCLHTARILAFDEDGQAYIADTLLTGWEA